MAVEVIVSVVALVISAALAAIQIHKYRGERRLAREKNLQEFYKAPAERDSIIVSGASAAVDILKTALADTREDNVRLRLRIDELEGGEQDREDRIRFLERQLARLQHERTI